MNTLRPASNAVKQQINALTQKGKLRKQWINSLAIIEIENIDNFRFNDL